jgi:hypothetical protein
LTWARFDDRYPRHRKVDGLSDAAFRLDVSAVCWCAENLTDGVVLVTELCQVSRLKGTKASKAAAELVAAGRWDVIAGGWVIHDYLDYNPSKAKVLAEREAARRRQERKRQSNGQYGDGRHAVTPAQQDHMSRRDFARTSPEVTPTPSRPERNVRGGTQRNPGLSLVPGGL